MKNINYFTLSIKLIYIWVIYFDICIGPFYWYFYLRKLEKKNKYKISARVTLKHTTVKKDFLTKIRIDTIWVTLIDVELLRGWI